MDQTSEDKKKEIELLAQEVMTFSRNSLFVHLRYMDLALGQLKPILVEDFPFATDGRYFFYDPITILKTYQKGQGTITHGYLHVILHCVFRHLFADAIKNRLLWDLACDVAVEEVIDELDLSVAKTPDDLKRAVALQEIKKQVGVMTAERIYEYYFKRGLTEDKIKALSALFRFDDHSIWYDRDSYVLLIAKLGGEKKKAGNGEKNDKISLSVKVALLCEGAGGDPDGEKQDELPDKSKFEELLDDKWKGIAERVKEDLDTFSKKQGDRAGSLVQNLKAVTREKHDYTAFLKKFATTHEDIRINDDEFDYVYYTYGLQLYRKMPLVEPLEYKEVKRIKDFVIAIDTSGSVRGDLVQSFLQKTYNILKNEESFFKKFNLHIVQCDETLQEDAKITTQKEFDEYLSKMKLHGFGGTDFRPVFHYVDKLIKEAEFTNLRGMIYFTDGYGTFPAKKPPYKVAFVFVGENSEAEVPPWAIKLVLRENEI